MSDVKVTDVRVHPGDSGFLIDDGETAILYDSGFAFTGENMVKNIEKQLNGRKLDYIFLTHSHYDHVLGALYAMRRWPEAVVIAGEYASKIFKKPSAKAVMRDLDKKFAITCEAGPYDDIIDDLRVDVTVNDGDTIKAGNMTFKVLDLPGHTKCSVGFYLLENKLLLSSETLGIYAGNEIILPSFLVGYEMTLNSIEKVEKLDVENILIPHYGLLDREHTKIFLQNAKKVARFTAEDFSARIKNGATDKELIEYFKSMYYHDYIKIIYPIDAIELNTSCMINLIRRECL